MIIDLQNGSHENLGPGGDNFFMENWSRAENFGPNMDQFSIELWSGGPIFHVILILQLQNCRGALYDDTYDGKNIAQIAQKGELICSRSGNIVGRGPNRHGSSQKPWRGDQNSMENWSI